MQIIHDSNAVFDITVNPFLKVTTIEHLPTSTVEVWSYDELDEWKSFSFEVEYDFHFYTMRIWNSIVTKLVNTGIVFH